MRKVLFRGEKRGNVCLVFYRYMKVWRPLPLVREFFRYSEWFGWGDDNEGAMLQLAAAILYGYHLKVLEMKNDVETAAVVTPFIRRFAKQHLENLPKTPWTLSDEVIYNFLFPSPIRLINSTNLHNLKIRLTSKK